MKVSEIFNIDELNKLVESGYISKRKHPQLDLWIYNYTAKVQYEVGMWNDITLNCRGLILDEQYNIVARPFKKFFNYEENHHTPTKDFKVYEKLDGSLLIAFYYKGKWEVSTRGSFESEQAIKGREFLQNYNFDLLNIISPNHTWLFEIIFKENTIVINYDYEGLVLLGAISNETGVELDIHTLELENSFKLCRIYNGLIDLSKIKQLIKDNEEGFIIKFSNNERCKIKGDEYCRLHRILTGVSNVAVWEYLSQGKDFNELLDRTPDEFNKWLRLTIKNLNDKFDLTFKDCEEAYQVLSSRKETALYFQTQKYPQVLFGMLDGKNVNQIIWKIIKPKWTKPFSNIEEN
ncbi:MAG: hypothetical protein LH629_08765 [Ignavibacteria bacterium]|nr:hypothetical protein [Ignavibacteria bacterium]